jgi:hypothetical protein
MAEIDLRYKTELKFESFDLKSTTCLHRFLVNKRWFEIYYLQDQLVNPRDIFVHSIPESYECSSFLLINL